MRFYYFGNDRQIKKLINDPLFKKISSYLYQNPNIILRQLKAVFSEENVEKTLEAAVKLQLISREERRYRLRFAVYDSAGLENMRQSPEFNQEQEKLFSLDKHNQQSIAYLMMKGISQLDDVFAIVDGPMLAKLGEVGNQRLEFVTLYLEEEIPLDLAAYFNEEARSQIGVLQPLTATIGDVDPVYFFDQIEVILERAAAGKKIRDSIFYQALRISGVLDEADQLQLPIMNVAESELQLPLDVGVESLLLISDWLHHQNSNVSRFIKSATYSKKIMKK